MTKIKYEKPTSLDAGQVAAIQGARCSDGNSADLNQCFSGFNPSLEPYCLSTGAVASGNCETSGNAAAKTCFSAGGDANWSCVTTGGIPG